MFKDTELRVATCSLMVSAITLILISCMSNLNHPNQVYGFSPTASNSNTSLTLSTDKTSYGFGDWVKVTGTIGEPAQGKTVRLDVYNSEGNVFAPFNDSIPAYVFQSDIQVKPNEKGEFSYRFPLGPVVVLENVKGPYKIEATYEGNTTETKFSVR